MSVTMSIDTSDINRSIDMLRRATGMADGDIIRNTTQKVLWNLVRFTFLMRRIKNRKFKWMQKSIEAAAKGRARLGWWPAWKALSVPGAPLIGNGPLRDRGEGGVVDASRRLRNPHVTVFNEVPYIEASVKEMNTLDRAMARQIEFINRAIDRTYDRLLKRYIA